MLCRHAAVWPRARLHRSQSGGCGRHAVPSFQQKGSMRMAKRRKGMSSIQINVFTIFISLFSKKPVGIYPGKYEWVSSPDLGDCSLRISAARADLDAGEWECQVCRLYWEIGSTTFILYVVFSSLLSGWTLAGNRIVIRCSRRLDLRPCSSRCSRYENFR